MTASIPRSFSLEILRDLIPIKKLWLKPTRIISHRWPTMKAGYHQKRTPIRIYQRLKAKLMELQNLGLSLTLKRC